MRRIVLFLAVAGLTAWSAPAAKAEFLVGLTGSNFLVTFDSATPGTTIANVAITGLVGGDTPLGIDYRPATGGLYAVARTSAGGGRLYTLNATTGAVTSMVTLTGITGGTLASTLGYGVDFNPTVDRLRVINDAGQNLRINVDTGAVTNDTAISGAVITSSAYTNNFPGATATQLFGIDPNADTLVLSSNPNGGTYGPVGPLGVNAATQGGFDIGGSGIAYAVFNTGTGGSANLYTINLGTGTATLVGAVAGTSAGLNGLAALPGAGVVAPLPPTALALVAGLPLLAGVARRRRQAR